MNKKLLRGIALALACVLLLFTVSCSGGKGKTLMTLKKDGVNVKFSVNLYQFMLTRMKGQLAFYGYTANGLTPDADAFWSYQDKFNGTDLQTIDEYYRDCILDNCRTYLAALYLFEKEGLSLSAADEEEIENEMAEILHTDGDDSKTKLNAVLASYGVNYELLKEMYTIEKKVAALQTHLYGENASAVGDVVKTEFLEENYVHFRQIFLAAYSYVYETDDNGDVIYYYTTGTNKDHICYDTDNGVTGTDENGNTIKDANGDTVYFVKDTDQKKIAYNTSVGEPAYVMTQDGSDYEKTNKTEDELKALATRAETLYNSMKNATAAEFEAAIPKESDDTADKSEYSDGYYLQKNVDYTASGATYDYLGKIVDALETMQVGEVTMVQSSSGYHIIMKYAHTEKAYEKEANEAWFETFYEDLIESLFLDECQKLYADIKVNEKVLATAPTMKEVSVNYYY